TAHVCSTILKDKFGRSATAGNTSGRTNFADTMKGLRNKFPELFSKTKANERASFKTGDSRIDGLFPKGGLPAGLLVELTGATSSGKTALLFHLLAGYQKTHQLAYVDCSTTFFPVAASAAGVNVEQLLCVMTNSSGEAVRAAENLFRLTPARVIVCDVTGRNDKLRMEQVHRLRLCAVKHQGLVIFLTDARCQMFPPSLMSLQMTVTRRNRTTVLVSITRSKISPEGQNAEVTLT
ncbi:MAG: hypothetical protein WBP42_10370, partial [Candidatus Zixiibacteriota bacterium]